MTTHSSGDASKRNKRPFAAREVMGQPGGDPPETPVMGHATQDPPVVDPLMAPPGGDPARELRVPADTAGS